MNKDDFRLLLNGYGVNIERWPEDLRDDAICFFALYPDLVQKEAVLDKILDDYKIQDLDIKLLELIINKVDIHSNDNLPIYLRHRSFWRNAIVMTACAIIGFYCGSMPPQTKNTKLLLLSPTKIEDILL
jgi:hypothetical protein